MENIKRKTWLLAVPLALILSILVLSTVTPTAAQAEVNNYGPAVQMYRLYNPNTGEHFYTSSRNEQTNLTSRGWQDEGTGWYAPGKSNSPVYRLYNSHAAGGDHHYTMDKSEYDYLCSIGWTGEGIGWYSDDYKTHPLYRQYNPYATTGTHNYTLSKDENDWLVTLGWQDENIAWYGCDSYVNWDDWSPIHYHSWEEVYKDIEVPVYEEALICGICGEYVLVHEYLEYGDAFERYFEHAGVHALDPDWENVGSKYYDYWHDVVVGTKTESVLAGYKCSECGEYKSA